MSHGIYHLKPDVSNLSQMTVVVMPAQANLVGGIMPGAGLAIDTAGVLSVSGVSNISVNGGIVGTVTNAPIEVNGNPMP
jgi:hypothetical protein